MLPVIPTQSQEFDSATMALEALERRTVQRLVLPLRDLHVDTTGRLSHVGHHRMDVLDGVLLTDTGLGHLHRLVGMPVAYARTIEPELHAHSINELMPRRLAFVSVFVEDDRNDGRGPRVAAVQTGVRAGVPHEIPLRRLLALGVKTAVSVRGGVMDVRFGDDVAVEILPGDTVRTRGALRNERWGDEGSRRPVFDAALYLLRLACENGAFAQRQLGGARMLSSASEREISELIDRQIHRVLADSSARLRAAAARMADDLPDDAVRATARILIARHASQAVADELLEASITAFELWNAITGAAHRAKTEAGRRILQIEGGELLDRYMAGVAA